MSELDVLEKLYSGLDREGPGCPEDVKWAVDRLGLQDARAVYDLGCGSGADSETLAQLLPEAKITAIEQLSHLAQEARERCAGLANVTVETGDMSKVSGPCDMIWCAGAIYFLGVREGLQAWRPALAPGAGVAFSEPVLLGPPDETVKAFWEQYPAITDLDGIVARVEAAGYEVVDHKIIVGAPWERFYGPFAKRLAMLRAEDDPVMREAVADMEQEYARWQQAPDRIAYALILVRPV